MISFRGRTAGAARRARRASCTPRSGSGRRSPRPRAAPKGWTVGAAYQAAELYDAVIYAAPAHCVDEIDLGVRRRRPPQDARQHRPSAGRRAGARLPPRGGDPPARRLRLPGPRGRAASACSASSSPRRSSRTRARGARAAHRVRRRRARIPTSPTPTCRRSPPGCSTTCGSCWASGASRPSARSSSGPRRSRSTISAYGRFKEIMDEVERRNPGLALAGSYRDGVAAGRRDRSARSGGRDASPSAVPAGAGRPA